MLELFGYILYNSEYMEDQQEKEEQNKEKEESEESTLEEEIRAGEWQNLRRLKRYRKRSRQGKIIGTYQAISNRLNQLVSLYYQLVGSSPKEAIPLLKELKKLQYLQEVLLRCLVWEPKGTITEGDVPEEVWDLIE